ncbi:MAG: hypothetical protein KJ063_09085 [Anaerolineae bacterium]|nr:hypothetical protein [Anaerolineae bacterium]
MQSYQAILKELPEQWRRPLLDLAEAIQNNAGQALTPTHREFIELKATMAAYQLQTDTRLARLEEVVIELAEAQKQTEQRVSELVQAQKQTDLRVDTLTERLDTLTQRVDTLTQRVDTLTQRVEELTEVQTQTLLSMQQLEKIVGELTIRVDKLNIRQDAVIGDMLELRYQRHAPGYFGNLLRRIRVLSITDVEDRLEEHLSKGEFDDALLTDLLISGRVRDFADNPEVVLVLEVSFVIDQQDVERANRRAALFRKAGFAAIPVVAGEQITTGAEEAAAAYGVLQVQNGHRAYWPQALQQAFPSSPASPT